MITFSWTKAKVKDHQSKVNQNHMDPPFSEIPTVELTNKHVHDWREEEVLSLFDYVSSTEQWEAAGSNWGPTPAPPPSQGQGLR